MEVKTLAFIFVRQVLYLLDYLVEGRRQPSVFKGNLDGLGDSEMLFGKGNVFWMKFNYK